MEDENLIKQAKNGSNQAFDKLLKKYNRLISRTVMSLVKDSCDAEEIICTVCVKLYKNIKKYTTAISFEAWIKTIAINTCIDYFRKVKNDNSKRILVDDMSLYHCDSYEPSGEDYLINNQLRKDIDKAIEMLPKRKRRVIELYFFENKSYKEIAKLLNTPEGTIKSDLSRAKQKLKTFLSTLTKQ